MTLLDPRASTIEDTHTDSYDLGAMESFPLSEMRTQRMDAPAKVNLDEIATAA